MVFHFSMPSMYPFFFFWISGLSFISLLCVKDSYKVVFLASMSWVSIVSSFSLCRWENSCISWRHFRAGCSTIISLMGISISCAFVLLSLIFRWTWIVNKFSLNIQICSVFILLFRWAVCSEIELWTCHTCRTSSQCHSSCAFSPPSRIPSYEVIELLCNFLSLGFLR